MHLPVLLMLLLVAGASYAGEEKPSRAEKEVDNLGRALSSAGKRAGKALERTGDNLWIKKKQKKPAKKKKAD